MGKYLTIITREGSDSIGRHRTETVGIANEAETPKEAMGYALNKITSRKAKMKWTIRSGYTVSEDHESHNHEGHGKNRTCIRPHLVEYIPQVRSW